MDAFKRCSKCKQDKPATLDYFCRLYTSKDGLNNRCKECQAEWRRSRHDWIQDYHRQYRQQNREQKYEFCKEWRKRRIINKHIAPMHLQDACQLERAIRRMIYGDALTAGMWRLERQCMEQIREQPNYKGRYVLGSYGEYLLYRSGRFYGVYEVRGESDAYLTELIQQITSDLLRRGWKLDDTRFWQGGAKTDPDMNVERVTRLLKQSAHIDAR